jgi:hypothetical protein
MTDTSPCKCKMSSRIRNSFHSCCLSCSFRWNLHWLACIFHSTLDENWSSLGWDKVQIMKERSIYVRRNLASCHGWITQEVVSFEFISPLSGGLLGKHQWVGWWKVMVGGSLFTSLPFSPISGGKERSLSPFNAHVGIHWFQHIWIQKRHFKFLTHCLYLLLGVVFFLLVVGKLPIADLKALYLPTTQTPKSTRHHQISHRKETSIGNGGERRFPLQQSAPVKAEILATSSPNEAKMSESHDEFYVRYYVGHRGEASKKRIWRRSLVAYSNWMLSDVLFHPFHFLFSSLMLTLFPTVWTRIHGAWCALAHPPSLLFCCRVHSYVLKRHDTNSRINPLSF